MPASAHTAHQPAAIHQRSLVIDSHIDISYQLSKGAMKLGSRREEGHFDLVRAREGGLDASFWVAFVPSTFNRPGSSEGAKGGAYAEALRQIKLVKDAVAANATQVGLASTPDELLELVASGKHAAVIALENGGAIEGDLGKLRALFDAGVRYVTPVHSRDNHLCDSSYDDRHTHGGLSAFGEQAVREMNQLGMMIDVSHVTDQAFWKILALSTKPVLATHSGLRHFKRMERNVSDKMLRALADRGGVLQINFGSWFLDAKVARKLDVMRDELKAMEKAGADQATRDAREAELWRAFRASNATVDDLVEQIDYAVKLVGADHVGLGSDFEGVHGTPVGLEDVSDYPAITAALLQRGYSAEQIDQINGGNLMRVWRANLEGTTP